MSPDDIRQAIAALPFRPFILHTADSRAIPVHTRDLVLVSPRGLTLLVFQPDDSRDTLDMAQIEAISFDSPADWPRANQPQ